MEEAAAHPFLRLDNQPPPRSPASISPVKPATPDGEENLAIATRTKTATDKGKKQTPNGPERRATSSIPKGKSGSSATHGTSPSGGKAGDTGAVGSAAGYGAAAAAAAGHSTLTASTAGLGSSDLCSVNSGFLDGDDAASFMTLRAEVVPTPATIGEGAAAAAARVRRATARAPFRGSAGGVDPGAATTATRKWNGGSGGNGGGSAGREDGGPRRTVRPLFDVEGDREAAERDPSANGLERDAGEALGVRSAAEGGGKSLRGRFGWRGSADVAIVADVSGRGRGGGTVCGRDAFRPDEGNARGEDGVRGGRVRCGNAGDLGDGRDRRRPDGGPVGTLAEAHGHPRDFAASFDSDDSGPGAGRLRAPSMVQKRQQQKYRRKQEQHQHQPQPQHQPRRRARKSRSTQALPHKQHQPTSVTGDRAARPRPCSTGSSSSSSSSGSGGGARSSEDNRPFAPFPGPRACRRRQREGGKRASRPPPPLPPQPPPQSPVFPPGEQPHASDFPRRLRELREVRAAAAAERRLHEGGCAGNDARGSAESTTWKSVDSSVSASPANKAAGDKSPLVPFSTARVKPVSHRSEGKAAGVQVFADGRASITVGRRWLMASEDGEQVWVGGAAGAASGEFSPSEGAAESRVEGRNARATRAKEACSTAAAAAGAGPSDVEEDGDAGYSLRSLPEEFHPLYRSLAGIVNALRSKTPKVVLRREPRAEDQGRAPPPPGGLSLCALMDNLPNPDFAAAFADGGSLSLWTRKNELRVELPCGRVRCWAVGPGSEWPMLLEGGVAGGEEGDGASGGGSRGGGEGPGSRSAGCGSAEEAAYLRAGLEGYCWCLREEAAAYQRRARFPVEVDAPAASLPTPPAGAAAADGGGKARSWWRGDEDSSSTSSESPRGWGGGRGFDSSGGCGGWAGGGGGAGTDAGGGSVTGSGTDWSGTLDPGSSGEPRGNFTNFTNDNRPGGSPASGHRDPRHHRRSSEPPQKQRQQKHQKPPLTPSTVLEAHPPPSKPCFVAPAAPWPLSGAAGQEEDAKRTGESLVARSDCSAPSEGGERACTDTSSLTCSSISEGCPAAGGGSEGGGGKGFDPARGSGPVERSRDDGAAAAVIPGLGEAFRNDDGGLEVRIITK